MKLFVCVFDDARLLPHFLRHYDRFGVTEFHIAAPADLANHVANASRNYRVIQYNDLNVAGSFTGGAEAVTKMRELAQGPEEWVVIVDLDEFVEFPEPGDRPRREWSRPRVEISLAASCTIDLLSTVSSRLLTTTRSFPQLFPVRARFRSLVMRGNEIKGVLVKGQLRSRHAHHEFHDERPYSQMLEISHYKWNDRAIDRTRLAT